MASEGLIAGLAAAWDDGSGGVGTGQVTLKSLARDLRAWMDGRSLQLGDRIEQMREQVAEVARATEVDLKQTLAPDLEAPLRGSLEVYEDLEPVLDALALAHEKGNRAVKNLVGLLDSYREQLLGFDQAMQAWLKAPVLRCPRCGAQPRGQVYVCSACRVDMLFPDPDSALSDGQSSAHLGPDYIAVFEAMSLVVQGDAPLSRLLGALTALEEMLSGWARMAEAEETSNSQLTYALDTVADAARRSLEGTAQMRGVADTRQTRDLNEGWRIVFHAAQEIRDAVPMIAKATGVQRGDHFSTQARFEDSIILEGDD